MSLLLFFAVLLLLVLVHEFGHFIVAKWAKIRVDEFAFGFPPRLFAKRVGETNYAFNALPLGGYVKIYGENPDDVTERDRKRSFVARPRWVQAAVIVAGVVMNIILAWVLISMILVLGIAAPVDDERAAYVRDAKLLVTGVREGSPAEHSGLKAGDALTTISDGAESVDAKDPESVSSFIAPREGRPVTISFIRDGVEESETMLPVSGIVPGGGAVGIYMDMVGTLRLPLHLALWDGAERTWMYTEMTAVGIYSFLAGTIAGDSDFSQVTGPVGIVNAVGDAAELGFTNLLLFTALISINLAVINLIPFPALDGGRLLFVLIEAVTRRAIKPVVANALNLAGFALLMLLMLAVTYHDIARLSGS